MTFSSLISGTIPHHNKYNDRPGSITRVIQHHWADTTMNGENSLASPDRKASVNYLIHNDGEIFGQVPEEFRPWTSGGPLADNPSITFEVQNETGGPEWRVSSMAQSSIVRLLVDVAVRYKFGVITETNYRGHREFAATACPGPYLWDRMQDVRDSANMLSLPDYSFPAPVSVLVPAPVRPNCVAIQRAVRTDIDNAWGSDTDKHCDAVREASTWGGNDFPWGVAFTQQVVGTDDDGKWGKNSRAAHDATVSAVQEALLGMGYDPQGIDSSWGDHTEAAYQAARNACHI